MTWDPSAWAVSTEVHVPKGKPVYPVFFNTQTGDGITVPYRGLVFPRGAWTRVDLSGIIAPDAKAVAMQAIMIITHGSNVEMADLVLNVKPPSSDENPANYEGQTIEPMAGSGQRTDFYTVVAVENCQFDFWWNTQTPPGQWPNWSSYGISMILQAFMR